MMKMMTTTAAVEMQMMAMVKRTETRMRTGTSMMAAKQQQVAQNRQPSARNQTKRHT